MAWADGGMPCVAVGLTAGGGHVEEVRPQGSQGQVRNEGPLLANPCLLAGACKAIEGVPEGSLRGRGEGTGWGGRERRARREGPCEAGGG